MEKLCYRRGTFREGKTESERVREREKEQERGMERGREKRRVQDSSSDVGCNARSSMRMLSLDLTQSVQPVIQYLFCTALHRCGPTHKWGDVHPENESEQTL